MYTESKPNCFDPIRFCRLTQTELVLSVNPTVKVNWAYSEAEIGSLNVMPERFRNDPEVTKKTYWATIRNSRGYMGIQNHAGGTTNIICSVWNVKGPFKKLCTKASCGSNDGTRAGWAYLQLTGCRAHMGSQRPADLTGCSV